MVRQVVDPGEPFVDPLRHHEGVEPGLQLLQLRDGGRVDLGTGRHAIERGPGRVIAAAEPRADAPFLDELHRGQEQVLQEPQIRIHRVDRHQRRLGVIPHIAEQLAHMGPVLLLDVGVVVLNL